MEDGPEGAEGRYERNGRTYTIEERDSEVWRVTDDAGRYLGVVSQSYPIMDEPWPHYVVRVAGEENIIGDGDVTDDWRAALDWLIDNG